MATLRETKKSQTRQLLLDKALALFESKGYAATTIDEIAASAGTTRTTFYQYFPSKSQLMQAVIRDVDEIFTTADDPPLALVIERGERALVERALEQGARTVPGSGGAGGGRAARGRPPLQSLRRGARGGGRTAPLHRAPYVTGKSIGAGIAELRAAAEPVRRDSATRHELVNHEPNHVTFRASTAGAARCSLAIYSAAV